MLMDSCGAVAGPGAVGSFLRPLEAPGGQVAQDLPQLVAGVPHDGTGLERSEEHTSELQSQSNLVCRLLLEKKKKRSAVYQRTGEPARLGALDAADQCSLLLVS